MKGKTVIRHTPTAFRLFRKMNRIIVLEHGKIIEQGTHDELLEKKGCMRSCGLCSRHGSSRRSGD